MERFHFIGLCGTAMAGVAAALKDLGYEITGSDAGVYPPMSTYLENHGIKCESGFDPERLNPEPDLVIIGNAVSRGNPEVERVLMARLPYMSLPELVRLTLIADSNSVVIAGTHGKTTTTALAAWVLEHAGRTPGYMIGGVPNNFAESCRAGNSDVFVIEGDEYDTAFFDKRSKFVHYAPDIAVINNIEFDHADIFRDLEDVMRSFRQLVNLIPANGLLMLNGDDENALSLMDMAHSRVELFGLSEQCYWRAVDIADTNAGTEFSVTAGGDKYGRFSVPFPGEFMVRNALAAIGIADSAGLSVEQIRGGLATFEGVKRRMEVLYDRNHFTVIDDFAHHHTAVQETLTALRKRYPGRRLVAAFEPRSNTSTRKMFQEELVEALSLADSIVIGPVNRPERYAPEERLDPEAVADALGAKGKIAVHLEDPDVIAEYLLKHRKYDDVIVIMSNGSFGGVHAKVVDGVK